MKASGKRWALCIGGVILLWVGQEISGGGGIFLITMGVIAAVWGSYTWAKEKRHSGWWSLLGMIAPIGYLGLMLLSDKSQTIDKNELQRCLAYLEEEWKFQAFQTREADLYNNALVQYGYSMTTDSLASKEMCRAASRLSQSTSEILKCRGGMASIPDIASAMYLAWQMTYSDYSAWAGMQYAAIKAVATGMQPHTQRVRELLQQSEKSRRKAENEEKRFYKRLNLNVNDVNRIISNASAAVAVDNWQPKETEEP
jgi:hypothetical protein